ncbi:TPA: hypothetical protein ACHSMM_004504 [Yersinia enterocolitica]
MTTFTHAQFHDITRYLVAHGQFTCFPGLAALRDCEELHDPEPSEHRDIVFIKGGFPFAVYECGFGFRVLPQSVDIPLTCQQFDDVAGWVIQRGKFTSHLSLDALESIDTVQACEAIEDPSPDAIEAATLYLRGGRPFALYIFDAGYYVIASE